MDPAVLARKANAYQRQIGERRMEQRRVQEKIERLESAKRQLESFIHEFDGFYRTVEKSARDFSAQGFRGTRRKVYEGEVGNLAEGIKKYRQDCDNARQAIVGKIRELQLANSVAGDAVSQMKGLLDALLA